MTSTETTPSVGASAPDVGVVRRRGSLPRWAMPGTFALAAVVALVLILTTSLNYVLVVVVAAMVATVAVVVASRAVEGSRKSVDRLVTCLVTGAFVLAILPLVSLVWTVVSKGLARLDAAFFTQSMLGILGPGGGA
jgi:phosphate transport system permease protein